MGRVIRGTTLKRTPRTAHTATRTRKNIFSFLIIKKKKKKRFFLSLSLSFFAHLASAAPSSST
jgi:hypothetical protein